MLAVVLVLALALVGCATSHRLDLPSRAPTAHPGSAILPLIDGKTVAEREAWIWDEVHRFNIPTFLRHFVSITKTRKDALGQTRTITYEVAPDYLALGSDQDFFRMPMTPALGQRIADFVGCSLPTRQMVDDIWQAAPVKLTPVTFDPTLYTITSPRVFWLQNLGIEAQRSGRPLGRLVAGTKKDVVVTARLATVHDRVAIYGWHRPSGVPIQPLSTVHVDSYVDYSHGIRLVRNRVRVDGRETTVSAVLADPVLHPLLSDEGVIRTSRYPMDH